MLNLPILLAMHFFLSERCSPVITQFLVIKFICFAEDDMAVATNLSSLIDNASSMLSCKCSIRR